MTDSPLRPLQVWPASQCAWAVAAEWAQRDPRATVTVCQRPDDIGASGAGWQAVFLDLVGCTEEACRQVAERCADLRFLDPGLPIIARLDPDRPMPDLRLAQLMSTQVADTAKPPAIVATIYRLVAFKPADDAACSGSAINSSLFDSWPVEPTTVLAAMLDNAPIGLTLSRPIEAYPYLEFYLWNRRLREWTGATMDEVNKQGAHRLSNPAMHREDEEDEGSLEAPREMTVNAGRYEAITEWHHPDGDRRLLSSLTITIEGPDGPFYLGMCTDITRMQALEQDVIEASEREQQRLGRSVQEMLDQQLEPALRTIQRLVDQLSPTPSASDSGSDIQDGPAQSGSSGSHDGEPPAGLQGPLLGVEQAIRSTLRELSLTAASLHTFSDANLRDRLAEVVHYAATTMGLQAELTVDPAFLAVDEVTANHLYRIAQEAISNIDRHAGATRMWVTLEQIDGNRRRMVIRDNGRGFQHATVTYDRGLRAMQSRSRMIGYLLRVESPATTPESLERAPGEGVGTAVVVTQARVGPSDEDVTSG